MNIFAIRCACRAVAEGRLDEVEWEVSSPMKVGGG